MDLSKKMIGIIIGSLLIILLAVIFWLKPNTESTETTSTSEKALQQQTGPLTSTQLAASEAQNFASKSQQDTQINCQIRADASNRLIVNEQTKDCFEYFITQYGEKTIEQIKADFLSYTKISYKEPVLSQLNNLWTRYIDYRSKLGDLPAPTADKESAKYYQQILVNTQNLRKKFFSNYEIQGLFGTQDTYDQYTVDRLEIMDNQKLSTAEKAQKLKELFEQLPEDWKENLKQLNQLEDLRKLTAEIKARGGSAEELRQMRTNLVGPEATQRLETLDVQRSDWKGKVNQYLAARDNILKSNLSDSAKQRAVEQLRAQQFANQQEQLRLQTFETVHDQGGKLPFAN
ncbi:lipase secretion chaperone [Acinetobacter sp. ULE_I057]|uniref:lipase secretion chaperone n=1 Tax=Acinetobacter sp. ULE_I057 TaxID=3373070 RepID=UPI003AF76FC2